MADVITRFRLETTQFDSKLRDSAKSLADLTGKLMIAGKDFDRFASKNVEAAKALGNIAPSANNAKDKVKELVTAYNDVARAYEKLTVEQKNSDYGKALADSLTQLKGKVTDAKRELYGLSDAMEKSKNASSVLDQLAQKFTINIDALKLFELGLKAANVAVDVAKDAFLANERQLDEWGAIVESSESLYKGFLNALNTGDINGYLNNINQIVRAASSAYNALDALGTFNAFNQVNVEKTRTNMTESIVDYREGKTDKNAVRAAGEAYKKELEERRRLEQEAYIETIGKVAAERGVSKQDLIDALSGSYGHYQDLKNVQPTGTVTKYSPGIMPGSQGTYTTYTVAQNRQEQLGEALRQLNDTELQSLQALGAQAQRTGNEIAQVDRQLVRVLNGRQGGGGKIGGGGGKAASSWALIAMQDLGMVSLGRSKEDIQKDINYWKKIDSTSLDVAGSVEAQKNVEKYERELATRKNMEHPFADAYAYDFERDIRRNRKEQEKREKDNGEKDNDYLKEMTAGINEMVGGVSQMVGGLEQLGIDLPKGFTDVLGGMQVIANILTAIQTISAAAAILPFAGGGIVGKAALGMVVPGNSFSGDNLRLPVNGSRDMIGVNSGEVILNQAQTNAVASALSAGSAMSNLRLSATIHGEDIILAVNNTNMRKGKGEFVTTKSR